MPIAKLANESDMPFFIPSAFFVNLRKAEKQELFTLLLTKRSKRKNLL